jgi:predicted RNA-binding protein YlxR (DUF448 family)
MRAPASELLRVVALGYETEKFRIVPDPTRRLPGRGANVHPVPACLTLAVRRRAFGRALRVTGVIDIGPLLKSLGIADGDANPVSPGSAR